MNRRKLLKIACASAGKTFDDFAQENGISKSHLSNVLKGRDTSKRIDLAIDEFIDEELSYLKINIPTWESYLYRNGVNRYALET